MFLRNLITTSTVSCFEQIDKLKKEIEKADAIIIGAGAGMSTSAGFTYDGERFEKYFSDFYKKYGIMPAEFRKRQKSAINEISN